MYNSRLTLCLAAALLGASLLCAGSALAEDPYVYRSQKSIPLNERQTNREQTTRGLNPLDLNPRQNQATTSDRPSRIFPSPRQTESGPTIRIIDDRPRGLRLDDRRESERRYPDRRRDYYRDDDSPDPRDSRLDWIYRSSNPRQRDDWPDPYLYPYRSIPYPDYYDYPYDPYYPYYSAYESPYFRYYAYGPWDLPYPYTRRNIIYEGDGLWSVGNRLGLDHYYYNYGYPQAYYSGYRIILSPPLVFRHEYYFRGHPSYPAYGPYPRYPYTRDWHPLDDERDSNPAEGYYKYKRDMKDPD